MLPLFDEAEPKPVVTSIEGQAHRPMSHDGSTSYGSIYSLDPINRSADLYSSDVILGNDRLSLEASAVSHGAVGPLAQFEKFLQEVERISPEAAEGFSRSLVAQVAEENRILRLELARLQAELQAPPY